MGQTVSIARARKCRGGTTGASSPIQKIRGRVEHLACSGCTAPVFRFERHRRIPPRVAGGRRSEVKAEGRAQPAPGDTSSVGHPPPLARTERRIPLPLDAEHLLQRMHGLDEVGLVGHDGVDVLVGGRNLVDDAAILAANDAFGLAFEIVLAEALARLRAAHAPAGAVGAGLEARGAALAANDVAARSHAAGNDAEFAAAGADSALARNPDIGAVVMLARDVVMVAVDDFAGHREGRQVTAQRRQHEIDHAGAVGGGVVLCPVHGGDIVGELRRPFAEPGQVAVGQLQLRSLGLAPRQFDEVLADGVADAAAARMQHDPDALRLVETDLDEMVAAAFPD